MGSPGHSMGCLRLPVLALPVLRSLHTPSYSARAPRCILSILLALLPLALCILLDFVFTVDVCIHTSLCLVRGDGRLLRRLHRGLHEALNLPQETLQGS